jgi:hypothetical protein
MVGLWVCCDGGFVGLWVCGFAVMVGLWVFRWWFAVDCGGGFAVSEKKKISFYVAPNTVKYFQTIFQNANKHWKNNHFP